MAKLGLYVRLHPKVGRERELQDLLEGALTLAIEEKETPVWFALRFADGTFGIFDAFDNQEGRSAHLNGKIAAALMANVGLLAAAPNIEEVDVLAAKLPG